MLEKSKRILEMPGFSSPVKWSAVIINYYRGMMWKIVTHSWRKKPKKYEIDRFLTKCQLSGGPYILVNHRYFSHLQESFSVSSSSNTELRRYVTDMEKVVVKIQLEQHKAQVKKNYEMSDVLREILNELQCKTIQHLSQAG